MVARIAANARRPLIPVDLETEEGVSATAHWLEWQSWADPMLQAPHGIKHSPLHIPNALGVRLVSNEAAEEKYLVA